MTLYVPQWAFEILQANAPEAAKGCTPYADPGSLREMVDRVQDMFGDCDCRVVGQAEAESYARDMVEAHDALYQIVQLVADLRAYAAHRAGCAGADACSCGLVELLEKGRLK